MGQLQVVICSLRVPARGFAVDGDRFLQAPVRAVKRDLDERGTGVADAIRAGAGEVFIEGDVTPLMLVDQRERANLQNEMEGAESRTRNRERHRSSEWARTQRGTL